MGERDNRSDVFYTGITAVLVGPGTCVSQDQNSNADLGVRREASSEQTCLQFKVMHVLPCFSIESFRCNSCEPPSGPISPPKIRPWDKTWQLMLSIAVLVMFRLCFLFETPQVFVQEVYLWYATRKGKFGLVLFL